MKDLGFICFWQDFCYMVKLIIKELDVKNLFYSTNGKAEKVDFEGALFKGLAPDGGLYMPDTIPVIPMEVIESFKDMKYHEIAYSVMRYFLVDLVDDKSLKAMTEDAYDFDVPLENVYDRKYIMRLDQGPTASFKDFAARMMARLMQYFIQKKKRDLLILVATSGDTGSAIANANFELDNINVCVLFPEEEVSDRQRKQMTTLKKNISAIAIDGKFDDCQALVKMAFRSDELTDLNLSSANSINFGRLLPQTVYYFYAYAKLKKRDEKMVVSIPSGNFGDMMGAVIAKKMGLPIEKLIISTNANDAFPKFLETGNYKKNDPSISCISNAMNVGHPSNLSRLVALYGGNMDENGTIIKSPDMELMREEIYSISVDDQTTRETIKSVYEKHKVVIEPHGAVGWKGLETYLDIKDDEEKLYVSVETAHPAKFPDEIKEAISIDPELPESLQGLEERSEEFDKMTPTFENFKFYLKRKFQ